MKHSEVRAEREHAERVLSEAAEAGWVFRDGNKDDILVAERGSHKLYASSQGELVSVLKARAGIGIGAKIDSAKVGRDAQTVNKQGREAADG